MNPKLSVVPATAEPVAQRVQRLQAEARALATDHVKEFRSELFDLMATAIQIAAGGDAYPVGVRELARRLVDELGAKADTLSAIAGRN